WPVLILSLKPKSQRVQITCYEGQYAARLLVFVLSYGHHRNLHSFPTRRSSDLNRSIKLRSPPCGGSCHNCFRPVAAGRSATFRRAREFVHRFYLCYSAERHPSRVVLVSCRALR